jgi:hypothetical protein
MKSGIWYSVKDQLPQIGKDGLSEDVLVIERKFGFSQSMVLSDGYRLACWDGKHWSDDNSEDIEDNPDYFFVVYWMSIPPTPIH